MDKTTELIEIIEANFRELAELTGEDHISAFIINGSFYLQSFGKDKLDYYKGENENE